MLLYFWEYLERERLSSHYAARAPGALRPWTPQVLTLLRRQSVGRGPHQAPKLLPDRRSNRMFSVRPETPWCGSAQSIVSLFKNENKKLKRFLESSGKRAFVSPAAASDLLISRISTIWLPKKKKGGPPRHMKNLDPPKRTSFPHSEPRRQFRLGGGPAGGDRLAPRLLSWGIFSGAE